MSFSTTHTHSLTRTRCFVTHAASPSHHLMGRNEAARSSDSSACWPSAGATIRGGGSHPLQHTRSQ